MSQNHKSSALDSSELAEGVRRVRDRFAEFRGRL